MSESETRQVATALTAALIGRLLPGVRCDPEDAARLFDEVTAALKLSRRPAPAEVKPLERL